MPHLSAVDLPAAICPITQEIMEDPVVCADGHSYERAAITQWLLSRDTSPATNTALPNRNVVPNYALRNLIAEIRGVRRPVTFEDHVAAAKPCAPVELDEDTTGPVSGTAPTVDNTHPGMSAVVSAVSGPRRDEETASAPEHAGEAAQPINPSKAVCRRINPSARRRDATTCSSPRAAGKNALHWAMVEGPAAEQKQLWLLLHTELAAQPDQGGNLPLHYAASAGVSAAVVVACALAYIDALEFCNKTGRTPLDVARLEGHLGIAAVLEGMRNRHSNDLHAAFTSHPLPKTLGPAPPGQRGSETAALAAPATLVSGARESPPSSGASGLSDACQVSAAQREEEQIALVRCRPDLASQRDATGNLPVHLAALHGATLAAVAECVRIFPEGPRMRNDAGFLPHQLALEKGHAALAEELAAAAGRSVPPHRINSVLARAAHVSKPPGEAMPGMPLVAPTGGSAAAAAACASGRAAEGDGFKGRGGGSARGVGGASSLVEGGWMDARAASAGDGGGSADGDSPADAEGASAAKALGKLSIKAATDRH